MRRAVLLLGLTGAVGTAWAGWLSAQPVSGVPSDVDVGDAGSPEWIGVATDAGGFAFVNGVLVDSVTAGGAAVGVVFDMTHSCLGAVSPVNPCTVTWAATCGTDAPHVAGASADLQCARVRQAGDTSAVASFDSNPTAEYLSYSPQAGTTAWGTISSVTLSYTAVAPVVASTAASGAVQGVFFAQNGTSGYLFLCSLTPNCVVWPTPSYVWTAPYDWMTDLEFLGPDGGEWVLFVSDGGLATLSADAGAPSSIGLPAGVTQVEGLSYEERTDPVAGVGFGMLAVDKDGGGTEILSAVPDPAQPARLWIPSSAQPTFLGALGHVRCLAGRVCGAVTNSSGAGNVLIYRNTSPPDLSAIPATFTLDGGTQTIFFDAGDPDGDAIFLTWALDGGTPPVSFTVLDAGDPQGRLIQINPGTVACGMSPAFSYVVVATDGVHESNKAITFTASGSGSGLPVLSDAGFLHFTAGGSAQSVSVDAGTACSLGAISVSPTTGAPVPVTVTATGNIVQVTPPADWCDPVNKVDTFVVQTDGGGSATLTVQVDPWGLPLTPFAPGKTVFQDAGTTATYGPDQTHPCADAGARVNTFWDAGPYAVSVNGPLVSVTLEDCEDAGLILSAYNQTANDALMAKSASSTLTITPAFSFTPLSGDVPAVSPGIEFSALNMLFLDAGVHISSRCPAFRGLQADVTLIVDGGTYSSATAPLDANGDGEATLPFPQDCNGVQYSLGAVVDGGGGASVAVTAGPFEAPALDAGIASVVAVAPFAQCGGPATGGSMTAATASGVGVCPFPSWSWVQSGGPAVTLQSASTNAVTFQTVDAGLELTGQTVTLTAQATVGGSVAQQSTSVTIGVQPFVTVQHVLQTAQPEALSLFGVSVTLSNTTACDVAGAQFDEYPDLMDAIPGTARVGGAPVDVGSDPTHLTFASLALPGTASASGQAVTLTYSARPRLLVGPAPHGHATLNSIPISGDSGLAPVPKGCGCTEVSVTDLGALLAVAGCVRWRRRKGSPGQRPKLMR